jgi:hypothetical protein
LTVPTRIELKEHRKEGRMRALVVVMVASLFCLPCAEAGSKLKGKTKEELKPYELVVAEYVEALFDGCNFHKILELSAQAYVDPDIATLLEKMEAEKAARPTADWAAKTQAQKIELARDRWIQEHRSVCMFADAKLFEYEIVRSEVSKDDPDRAIVSNRLVSQDRFANFDAGTEFELYTIIKEDGRWKFRQQVLIQDVYSDEFKKWFPGQ